MPALRTRLARALDPAPRAGPGLSPANRVVVGVVLVSIGIGVLDTEATPRETWSGAFPAGLLAGAFAEAVAEARARGREPDDLP